MPNINCTNVLAFKNLHTYLPLPGFEPEPWEMDIASGIQPLPVPLKSRAMHENPNIFGKWDAKHFSIPYRNVFGSRSGEAWIERKIPG
ncbi:hypothetical protein TNCV_3617031 [Trichonephila clavipes]|nr:hypothetical protein TNCV_3617031 [Trichonephila clavipes]